MAQDRVDHRDLHRLLDAIEKLKEQHEEREKQSHRLLQQERRRADAALARADSLAGMLNEKDFVVDEERKIAEGERKRAEELHASIQERERVLQEERKAAEAEQQAASIERNERQSIARQSESLQQHIEMLREQLHVEKEQRQRAEDASKDLEDRAKAAELRCETLQQKHDSGKDNLRGKIQELVETSHELATLSDTHDNAMVQLDRVTHTIHNCLRFLQIENNDSEHSFPKCSRSRAAALKLADSCLALERGVREVVASLEDAPAIEDELRRLRLERDSAQKRAGDSSAELSALEQQNRRLQEQVYSLKQELSSERSQREKEEAAKTEQRHRESAAEVARMKATVEALQMETLARRSEVEELHRRLSLERAQKAAVTTKHQVLVEQLAAAEQKLKTAFTLPHQFTPATPAATPTSTQQPLMQRASSSAFSGANGKPTMAAQSPSLQWSHGYKPEVPRACSHDSHVTFAPDTGPGEVGGWEVWRSGDTLVTRTRAPTTMANPSLVPAGQHRTASWADGLHAPHWSHGAPTPSDSETTIEEHLAALRGRLGQEGMGVSGGPDRAGSPLLAAMEEVRRISGALSTPMFAH